MIGRARFCRLAAIACASLTMSGRLWATDIIDVLPAAMDQPQINAYISLDPPPTGQPLSMEGSFNITGYLDTGASGVLLSINTAGYLNLQPSTFNNPATGQDEEVLFTDVGAVGGAQFYVSQPVHISLAPYHPNTDVDNIDTYTTVYNHHFGPIRTQLGPVGLDPDDPTLGNVDIFGVPVMQGKVIVLDPRPVDTFMDSIRTYVYDPGTPYNKAADKTNPGIPLLNTPASRHIKLSYADFTDWTSVSLAGAPKPTMCGNPFIGPSPLAAPGTDHTPPLTVTYKGVSKTGSFLLDTGAASSMISTNLAAQLGVTFDSTAPADQPVLLYNGTPIPDQFTLGIGGVGGTAQIAGFYLDSLLIHTIEGDTQNNPNLHLNFLKAPVLVTDITMQKPGTNQLITLDGVLGMNFLVASASFTMTDDIPIFTGLSTGPFKWVVFDQPNATLGVELAPPVPEKQVLKWCGDIDVPNIWSGPVSLFPPFLPPSDIFLPFTNPDGDTVGFHDGDEVTFDDSGPGGIVGLFTNVAPSSITVDGSLDYTFQGQTDWNTGTYKITGNASLTKKGTGTLTIEMSNDFTGPTEILEGTVILAAPQKIGTVNVHNTGRLVMQTSQHFYSLGVQDGSATLDRGPDKIGDKLLVLDTDLNVAGTGQLDLNNNAAVVLCDRDTRAAVLARVTAAVGRARNPATGGVWTGPGITSTDAQTDPTMTVAVFLNDRGNVSPFITSFRGQTVDESTILVFYATLGDLNLDNKIDTSDYLRMDFGMLTGSTLYQYGDLNYDGVVNADDYGMMDGAFLNPARQQQVTASAIAVPEPASATALAAALLLLPRRRRA